MSALSALLKDEIFSAVCLTDVLRPEKEKSQLFRPLSG